MEGVSKLLKKIFGKPEKTENGKEIEKLLQKFNDLISARKGNFIEDLKKTVYTMEYISKEYEKIIVGCKKKKIKEEDIENIKKANIIFKEELRTIVERLELGGFPGDHVITSSMTKIRGIIMESKYI